MLPFLPHPHLPAVLGPWRGQRGKAFGSHPRGVLPREKDPTAQVQRGHDRLASTPTMRALTGPPPSWPPYLSHFDLCPWVGRNHNPCPNPSFQRVLPAQGSSPIPAAPHRCPRPPSPPGSHPLGQGCLSPARGGVSAATTGGGGLRSSWPTLWSGGLLCLVLKRQLRSAARGVEGGSLGGQLYLQPCGSDAG